MKTYRDTPQGEIEKSIHRRIFGAFAASAWISTSATLLLPLALIGPLETDYESIMKRIYEFIHCALYSDTGNFMTLVFGVVAACIALYALTAVDRSKNQAAEFIEHEILGVYISRVNIVLSIIFGALIVLEVVLFVSEGIPAEAAYVTISLLIGYSICGFLAGFHIRGEYLKYKSYQEAVYLLNWLESLAVQNGARFKRRSVFWVVSWNALAAVLFVAVGSVSLVSAGLSWNGVFATALFGAIYCSVLVYMLYTVRISSWDTRRSGRASQGLMNFVNVLIAIMIVGSEIVLVSYFTEINTFGQLIAVTVVWVAVVVITWFYRVASQRYRDVIRGRQLRMVGSRLRSARESIRLMQRYSGVKLSGVGANGVE